MKLFERNRPAWMRKVALFTTLAFIWSMVIATPLQVLANIPQAKEAGIRRLTNQEMKKIVGSDGGLHTVSISYASGGTFPW